MSFKQIKYILINETLKEFYSIQLEKGKGVITNHKGGALIFDLFEELQGKLEIDEDIKKPIWKACLKEFKLVYSNIEVNAEKAKVIKEMIYKARLMEHYLNHLLETQNKSFNYVGDELPRIIGIKHDENMPLLRDYKNELEMAIFTLSPEE